MKEISYMNVTDQFIQYLLKKNSNEMPQKVIEQAKKCLVDYIGVTSAGAKTVIASLDSYLKKNSDGEAKIIGIDQTTNYLSASFLNGFCAHVMELDDGHRFGMIHLAAPIISSVLSAAQMVNASGDILLRAIVIGYEAAVRLAISIQPEHKLRGFHTAGTCGTIGAAVGAGYIFQFNEKQMKTAISVAGTSAAGLLEIQENGSELKPYNVAQAAMNGLNAAMIGLSALKTPNDILGGARGFSNVLADGVNLNKMTENTDYYEIERVYMKPYAACRHCHPAIEAAIQLRNDIEISPDNIASINVDTYKLAVKGHDHTKIEGVPSAKLSIPFGVAVGYILRDCGIDTFTKEYVEDKNILSLTEKVHTKENIEFTRCTPAKRITEVTVTDLQGKAFSYRVEYAKGEPENPMTFQEIEAKYQSLMIWAGREKEMFSILDAIKNIEQDASVFYKSI